MAKNNDSKGLSKNAKVAIGAAAGVALAATAAYLLTGEKGKKNRKKIKQWSNEVQRKVEQKLKKLKEVNVEDYLAAMSAVVEHNKNFKKKSASKKSTAPKNKK